MFVEFGDPEKTGVMESFGGVIGDMKWLIILLIALPLSLWILKFLINLFQDMVEKKKMTKDIELLNIGFSRYLTKKDYNREKFEKLSMTEKRKLFKKYAGSLEEEQPGKKGKTELELPGYMTKTLFKKLRKTNLKKRIKE